MSEGSSISGLPRAAKSSHKWLLASLVFVVIRSFHELTFPIYRDQATYCMIGQSLWEGKQLYRDLWDNKPPGIFYLYALIVKVFGPVMWSVGLIDILCLLAISYALYRFAEGYLGTAAGVVAVVFNVTWHVRGGNLYSAQPETFILLFFFAALALVCRSNGGAILHHFAAGLFLGVAFLVKYNGLAFLPLVVLIPYLETKGLDEEPCRIGFTIPARRWLGRAAVLVTGFAATVALVLVYFRLSGSWEPLKEVQFKVLPRYTAEVFDAVPIYWVWVLTQTVDTLGGWTEFMTAAALLIAWKRRELSRCAPIFLAVAFSYLSVAMQVRFHDYYFQTCQPFFAVIWAYVLVQAGQGVRVLIKEIAARGWRLAHPLVWVLVANVVYWPVPAQVGAMAVDYAAIRDWVRDPDLYYATSPWSRPIDHFGDQLRVIRYIKENSAPEEGVYVWGTDPLIYFLSERRPPSRFVTNLALVSPWSPPEWRDELVRDLRKSPPRFIVVARKDEVFFITRTNRDSEQFLETYPQLAAFVSCNYKPVRSPYYLVIYRRQEACQDRGQGLTK